MSIYDKEKRDIYLLTLCKGEKDEELVKAILTSQDVEIIKLSIRGDYNCEYLIETTTGKTYDVGIIDEIELLEKDISEDDLEELRYFREMKEYFCNQIASPYWDSIAERLSEVCIALIEQINRADSPKQLSWLVLKNAGYVKERIEYNKEKIKKEFKAVGVELE